MTRANVSYVILRLGVAFILLYPPYAALGDPTSWLSYFPPFVLALVHTWGISDITLLYSFGVFEVVLALWILSGWRIFTPSLVTTALLLAIVAFGYNDFEVLFRDVGLAAAALSLAIVNLPAGKAGWPKRQGGSILPL
jgi:hypothetical protein